MTQTTDPKVIAALLLNTLNGQFSGQRTMARNLSGSIKSGDKAVTPELLSALKEIAEDMAKINDRLSEVVCS